MGYKELARAIKAGYNNLKKDTVYKLYNVAYSDKLGTSEITVKYAVEVKETLKKTIIVEAENIDEALQKVEDAYNHEYLVYCIIDI